MSVTTEDGDRWEAAALAQLRSDVLAYPGGARKFIARFNVGIGYYGLLDNLNGTSRIGYGVFTRCVYALGYSMAEYTDRILSRRGDGS